MFLPDLHYRCTFATIGDFVNVTIWYVDFNRRLDMECRSWLSANLKSFPLRHFSETLLSTCAHRRLHDFTSSKVQILIICISRTTRRVQSLYDRAHRLIYQVLLPARARQRSDGFSPPFGADFDTLHITDDPTYTAVTRSCSQATVSNFIRARRRIGIISFFFGENFDTLHFTE